MNTYFNCHSHTMYSNIRLLDCINRPKDLIKTAKELGLCGIAITDHECLSSHMEVNKFAKSLQETDPNFTIALGNEIYLTDDRESNQKYYQHESTPLDLSPIHSTSAISAFALILLHLLAVRLPNHQPIDLSL